MRVKVSEKKKHPFFRFGISLSFSKWTYNGAQIWAFETFPDKGTPYLDFTDKDQAVVQCDAPVIKILL